MRLNDDVYVLSLPMNYGGETHPLNLSLILDQANGPTLVDAGLPGQETLIEAALAEAGVAVRDLRRIIITHQDMDHVGSLHALVEASGARVLAHTVEIPYIDGHLRPLKVPSPEMLAQRPELAALRGRYKPTPVDEPLEDGAHLDLAGGVRIVFTPGHTPGHMSLYLERTRTLIAGDALTAEEGQLHGPSPRPTLDMAEARRSVRKLAQLAVQTIVCYHSGVVSENAEEQLRRVAEEESGE